MQIRKATVEDVESIQELIQQYAAIGLMLPRTAKSIYEHLQNFTVADQDGAIVGTVGLHILWKDLAEVRSLAVSPTCQGQGLGRKLVSHTLLEAEQLGIEQVLSLTYQTEFFSRLGFEVVKRDTLPRKVWKDCVICKKFDRCDEIAMVYYTRPLIKVQPLVQLDTTI